MNTLKTTAPNSLGRQATLESVKKMSDEELRVKVAELHGFKMVEFPYAFPSMEMLKARFSPKVLAQIIAVDYEVIPDYPHDLNAAIGVAKLAGQDLMDADQWEKFGKALLDSHPTATLDDMNGGIDFGDLATFVSDLTARTICEATVLSLSLKGERSLTVSRENKKTLGPTASGEKGKQV